MKYQFLFLWIMTIVCLSNLTCSSAVDPPSAVPTATNSDSNTFGENDDVELVIQQYEALGKKYTAILADEKQSAASRGRAAGFLGKMKYIPGIPKLIQHLTLVDPTRRSTGDDLEQLVSLLALLEYGDLAIPSVINAYLEETDPIENECGRDFTQS